MIQPERRLDARKSIQNDITHVHTLGAYPDAFTDGIYIFPHGGTAECTINMGKLLRDTSTYVYHVVLENFTAPNFVSSIWPGRLARHIFDFTPGQLAK